MVLMNPEAVTYSWVGTSAGRVGEAAQEGISAGIAGVGMAQGTLEVGMAQGTLEVGMAQGTLEVGMAQGTLGVGIQEEAGRAVCTAAVDKTSFFSSLRI
jgi:hypothetical protein